MSQTVSSQHPAVVLRSHYEHLRALLGIAIAVILALTVAVVVLAANDTNPTPARPTTESAVGANLSASLLRQLTPAGRKYVLGIMSMTPAEVHAAFGTSPTSVQSRQNSNSAQVERSAAQTLTSVLRSLTPAERRYVQGIASLTPLQRWAAFGTTPTPPMPGGGTANTTTSSATTPGP